MPFSRILGQKQAKEFIRAALQRERLGHAYLFAGPDGVGKTLFAVELAKVLLCHKSQEVSCDQCRSCRMVDHGRHPDLTIVEAEPGKRIIKIEQARDLRNMLHLMPVEGDRRVVILREADHMEAPAANALLKTLEEPTSFTLLILTTCSPRTLLPTIRSRCQELRFAPLSTEQVQRILSEQRAPDDDKPLFTDEEIRLGAELSNGSAGRAIQIIESGCLEIYEDVVERMRNLPAGDLFAISDAILEWAAGVSRKLEPRRQRLRVLLNLLARTYHDMLSESVEGHVSALPADQQRVRRLLRIIEAIWDARRQTDANAAMNLILDHLLVRVAELQAA